MPALERAGTLADLAGTSPAVATALQGYQDLWGRRGCATRWRRRRSSIDRSGCYASSRVRPRRR